MRQPTISERETVAQMIKDIKAAVFTQVSHMDVIQTSKQLFTEGVTNDDEYYFWMRIAQYYHVEPTWNGRLIPCYYFGYITWENALKHRITTYLATRTFTWRDLEYYFDVSNPDSRGLLQSTLQKLVYDHFLESDNFKKYWLVKN